MDRLSHFREFLNSYTDYKKILSNKNNFIFNGIDNSYRLHERMRMAIIDLDLYTLSDREIFILLYEKYLALGGFRLIGLEQYWHYMKYDTLRISIMRFWTSYHQGFTETRLKCSLRILPEMQHDLRICIMMGEEFKDRIKDRNPISYEIIENATSIRIPHKEIRSKESKRLEKMIKRYKPYTTDFIIEVLAR